MPAYRVADVAFAVGSDPKWIDNLLSHRLVRGSEGGQRGVARRIETDGAVLIALTRLINRALGIPIDRALELSEQILDRAPAPIELAPGLTLMVDTTGIRQAVESRLAEAIEVAVQRRRGRPRAEHLDP